MNIIPTTQARKKLSILVDLVRSSNRTIIIGRHHRAEAILIKFPDQFNNDLDAMTNMNQFGGSFDFLNKEPDLYTKEDIKKSYV